MRYLYKGIFVVLVLMLSACQDDDLTTIEFPNIEGRETNSEFSFELTAPNDDALIAPSFLDQTEEYTISWQEVSSESSVSYTWVADSIDNDFSDPLLSIASDQEGALTTLTLQGSAIIQALADLGVEPGETITLKWNVYATTVDGTYLAKAARLINLKRPLEGAEVTFTVSVPDITPGDLDVFVAGQFGDMGVAESNWQQPGTNPDLQLTDNGDGTHTLTVIVPFNLSGSSFEYKYFLATTDAPSWGAGEQDFDGMGGCEGVSNRSYTYNGSALTISESVNAWEGYCPDVLPFTLQMRTQDVPAGVDVFVAGEFGKLGVAPSDWQQPGTNSDLQLTYDDVNDVYSIVLNVPSGNVGTDFQYKYFLATTSAPSWSNGEQKLIDGGCGGVDNRQATFTMSGQTREDEVTVWEGYCPSEPAMRFLLTVTNNFPSSAELDVYIAGSLGFVTWPQPGTDDRLKMTSIGNDQYEVYLPVPSGHSGEFKFFLATKETPNWGNGEQQVNGTNDGCEGVGNRAFTFTGSESVDATVNVWEGYCPF